MIVGAGVAGASIAWHLAQRGCHDVTVIERAEPTSGPDRYTVRRSETGLWAVWDTRRDEPVFGGETLSEAAAREMARRLNEAYRRLHPDQ